MCCLRKISLLPLNIWYLHNLTHLFLIVGSERWLGLHNHYTPEWSMILVWEVTNQSLNLQLVTTCSGVLTQRRNIFKLLRGYSTVSLVTKNAFVYCLKLRTFFKVGVLYVYCWLAFTLIHFCFNQLSFKKNKFTTTTITKRQPHKSKNQTKKQTHIKFLLKSCHNIWINFTVDYNYLNFFINFIKLLIQKKISKLTFGINTLP